MRLVPALAALALATVVAVPALAKEHKDHGSFPMPAADFVTWLDARSSSRLPLVG